MVAAVYTSDLTDLIPADTTTLSNWASLGGGASGLNIETDYFIQGSSCVSKNAFASATKGMVEDTTNTALTAGDLSATYTWVTHLTPGSLDTKAAGGISIAMGSASNTLNQYYYAGSDTIDYGAPWICAVVDPENATASSGTVTHANMDTYGAQAKLVGGPTKGAPLGIDSIRQGRSYEITEGDAGAPATFTAAATKNDLTANRYGQFQGVPGIDGSYTMQCHLSCGTAATAAYFDDSNANISLNDLEYVSTDFQLFEVVNASTTQKWTNVTISAVGTNARGNFKATSSLLIEHNTCTFNDMGTFIYDSNSTATNCTYRRCDQISGTGTLTDCTIDSSTNASAILSSGLSTITGCSFTSDGSSHAVELSSIGAGSMTWNNTATNYDAGATGSPVTPTTTGNEDLYVNVATGTLTVNVASGASIPSIRSAGATVNVVAGLATVKAVCQDSITKALISGVGVILRAGDTVGGLPFKDAVTITRSGSVATVTHTGHGLGTNQYIEIADADQNEYNRVKQITVTGANDYTFTVSGAPTTPATGTILATAVILFGDTDINGEIEDSRSYSVNQDSIGDAKKGSSAPTYVSSPISGTIDSGNGATFTILMNSDD